MITFKRILALVLGLGILALTSCKDDDTKTSDDLVMLDIHFLHYGEGQPLLFDSLIYVNEAGNKYEVTEIQWFVSDIILTGPDKTTSITQNENIHYIDTNIPETSTWTISEGVPVADYTSLTLTFGLKDEKNTVGKFTDPPEANMIWPFHIGGDNGGYHYMKLNGFWIDVENERQPFNFHLGVGSVEEGGETTFIQNWFEVTLPLSIAQLSKRDTVVLPVVMNVENWFGNPNTWDHDVVGPKIMKNQTAMRMGIENGMTDGFSIGNIEIINHEE